MESSLEVLSRAATMVQDNSAVFPVESRLTSKELPTTKWRRDRRSRVSSEYTISSAASPKPLTESNNTSVEIPLDMSVQPRTRSPPPPYREPLPGSTFASTSRPSVITQAPKRDTPIANQENNKTAVVKKKSSPPSESISMIDPVIDEHFRRSLGADYMNLFGQKKSKLSPITTTAASLATKPTEAVPVVVKQPPTTTASDNADAIAAAVPTPAAIPVISHSPQSSIVDSPESQFSNHKDSEQVVADSVDDHFAKALGDTWKKLKDTSFSEQHQTDRELLGK